MKKLTVYQLILFFGSACMAQTSVDVSQLEFEKTENKSVIYTQYAAKTRLSAPAPINGKIEINLGAGSAEIVQSNDNILRAEAEIILSVKNEKKVAKALEDLELYLDAGTDKIALVSKFDYHDQENEVFNGFLATPERRIDIKIYVPKGLKIQLRDRAGDIQISDIVNDLKLTDGSGSIHIDGLEGNLKVDDNSGDIIVKNVNKKTSEPMVVKIKDASDAIYLSDVNGDTRIDDTSGGIEVKNLEGTLTIDDTSGGITARNIYGDSKILDTSGEIRLISVDGSVTISDTSGGIYVDTVSQDVTLRSDGSGSFTTKNIKGNITKRS